MHPSNASSSSTPASSSFPRDRTSQSPARTGLGPSSASLQAPAVQNSSSFDSQANSGHSRLQSEAEYLRSALPGNTAALNHSDAAQTAISTTTPVALREIEPACLPADDRVRSNPSHLPSVAHDSPGQSTVARQQAQSIAPKQSLGGLEPPWNTRPTRRSRSSSPARKTSRSPASSSGSASPSPDAEYSVNPYLNSQGLDQPSPHIPPKLEMHSDLMSLPVTSLSAPPRSPILAPSPKSLRPGSPRALKRDHSPSLRIGSPLAQSISPVPGWVAESGNGILSQRLSPNPSPNVSPAVEITNPLSPRAINLALLPRVDEVDQHSETIDITDYSSQTTEGSQDYFDETSQYSTPTGQSPLRPEGAEMTVPSPIPPQLQIISPELSESEDDDLVIVDHDMGQIDDEEQQAMFLDDEGLTALEKIYLYSRSTFPFHRTFISKQLPYLIREVPPSEAVEYVCPLLNGLGTDQEENVKEVFVQELVPIIWWFFMHCQVIDHEQPEPDQVDVDIPHLPSNAFTPLIGSLLLSANPRVGDGARLAIVELLNRLQGAQSVTNDERYCVPPPNSRFGIEEKKLIIDEIMNGVVLGMGRLDQEYQDGGEPIAIQSGTDEGLSSSPSPGYDYRRTMGTPPRNEPTPPEGDTTITPPDGGIPLYRTPSRREVSSIQPVTRTDSAVTHDPVVAGAPFLDYFDSPVTRERPMEPDGWMANPAEEESEEMSAAFQIQGTPHTGLAERIGAQELATIDEEETATNDTGEEATVGRVASMSVVAAIAANATMPPHMQEVFVQEVWRVGSDSVYWVRREASFAIGALAKVVPLEMVTTYLLPLYELLVQDEQWHVRHSILFALPGILARINADQRRKLTVPSLVLLSRDHADPVRSGLLEVLGEVIYTFRDDPSGPPRELLDLFAPRGYLWTPEEPSTPGAYYDPSQIWFRDPERPIICAFNFPAVILTLGRDRWSEVRDYYLYLTNNPAPKVLRTLAASLGEVASIIGPHNAEKDLVPVFLSSLRSSEQEVRGKIIEALPKFSQSLSEAKRERIAGELLNEWPKLGSWREREDLAHLLGDLVSLVGGRVDFVVQLMGYALRDEVAAVRNAAVRAVPAYLKALEPWGIIDQARTDIMSLSGADSYRRRVTFVACALYMVQETEDASEMDKLFVWGPLAMLARDGIVDTRIGVARLVSTACERFYPTRSRRPRYLESLLRLLTNDENAQVRLFVSYLLDEAALASGSVRETSPFNERGFAVFSKPPRVLIPADDQEEEDDEDSQMGELSRAVTSGMGLQRPEDDAQQGDDAPSSSTEYVRVTPLLSPVSAAAPLSRPQLVSVDSSETGISGTSRGEESQASPRTSGESDSPRTRSTRSRRPFVMTLSDLPGFNGSGDLTIDNGGGGHQSVTITLTPSPGSETRRISFDTLSNHSDSSDSSGRIDPIPLPRRSSFHRISSDSAVSVASG